MCLCADGSIFPKHHIAEIFGLVFITWFDKREFKNSSSHFLAWKALYLGRITVTISKSCEDSVLGLFM